MLTKTFLLVSALLLTGCSLLPQRAVLIDRSIPHQLAQDQKIQILARQPDGAFVSEWILAQKGDWVASQEAISGQPLSAITIIPGK